MIQLDLSNSPIEEIDNYRTQVFAIFPNLQILDNLDSNGNPIDYSDDEDEEANYEDEGSEEDDEMNYIDEFDDDEIDVDEGEEDIGGGKKLKA